MPTLVNTALKREYAFQEFIAVTGIHVTTDNTTAKTEPRVTGGSYSHDVARQPSDRQPTTNRLSSDGQLQPAQVCSTTNNEDDPDDRQGSGLGAREGDEDKGAEG